MHLDDVTDVSIDGTVTIRPYVACRHCKKVLSYDKVKGGTSHLRRHTHACCSSTSQGATRGIAGYFKSLSVPSSVKSDITMKCVEFVCKDIWPFETVAGARAGFAHGAHSSCTASYSSFPLYDIFHHTLIVTSHYYYNTSCCCSKAKQDRAGPGLNFDDRAGPTKNEVIGLGRAGSGLNFAGPQRAVPENFVPCRTLLCIAAFTT